MIEFAPRSSKLMTYDEAVLYCQFLDYNGHKDWRMATRTEYNSIRELAGWYVGDTWGVKWYVVPVRDIC